MKDDIKRMNRSKNVVTSLPSWVIVEPLILFHEKHCVRACVCVCLCFKLACEGDNLFSLLIHQSRKFDYFGRLITGEES